MLDFIGNIVGGLIQGNAAKSAAKTQAAAADKATQLQRDMYEQTRADQMPWHNSGIQALNRMNALLGLPPVSAGGSAAAPGTAGAPQMRDYNALRASMLPQFTTYGGAGGMPNYYDSTGGDPRGGGGAVDEQALRAAIEAEMAKDQTAYNQWSGQQQAAGQQQPGNALAAFQADPGYQFRLGEGNKAIERAAASRGGMYSGATLKALQRFGQDHASNEFGNVFGRLSTVAGFGPAATNAIGSAGQNFANQAGANAIGAGNAIGASRIAQGNIWGNALNQGIATWGRGSAAPSYTRPDTSSFRWDDPYQGSGYFGGSEGE
jgi:hypothetical protein